MMKSLLLSVMAVITLSAGLAAPSNAGDDSTLPPGSRTLLGGPCGSSYRHIGHYPIKNGSGTTLAYMDVYWSGTSKRNCLVTNHYGRTYGVKAYTEAKIRPSGRSWPSCPSSTGCDGGFYNYYAGPVYTPRGVNMSNRCIDISGVIDWKSRTKTRIHCG